MGFSDAWKKAGEPVDDFQPPNGTYEVRIVDGGAFTGADGRQWAKVVLRIIGGEHADREFTDFMNLNNDVGLRIARTNLAMYGLAVESVDAIEDLDNGICELEGTVATVGVKTSAAGFLNTTVHSVKTGISDIPERDGSLAPPRRAHDDDDVPF